jgi:hypothetical protein
MLSLCDYESIDECDEDFCLIKDKRKWYGDKKVKDFDLDYGQRLKLKDFIRNSDTEDAIKKIIDDKYNVIVYSDDKYDLGYIHDSEHKIIIFTDHKNSKYIIVGICGSHPFIITPKFHYGNSDGSCMEYDEYFEQLVSQSEISVTNIYATLWMLYYDFINNGYH